jgi:hypothetical protein
MATMSEKTPVGAEGVTYNANPQTTDNADAEKGPAVDTVGTDTSSVADSDRFQGGVQRVRGVTSVWSGKTMWTMFGL